MIGLAITAVVLLALAMLQLGVKVLYAEGEAQLSLRIGFFRLKLPEGKDKPAEQTPKPAKPKTKKPKDPVRSAKQKAWIKAVLQYLPQLTALVGKVLRSPTLDVLKLHILVGAADPEVCAMNYGKINAAIGAALPVVENVFSIRRRSVSVDCDFMKDQNEIDAHVEITVRLYQLIAIAASGVKLLYRLYQAQKSLFKAVLQHESSSS